MKISKQQVEAWLQNPNFDTGINLLRQINPSSRVNTLQAITAKLCYHVGIAPLAQVAPLASVAKVAQVASVNPSTHQPINPSTPVFIERIIKEHSRLVNLRSQLADERLAIPEANNEPNNKKRKILSESIHQHSQRIEALYTAKENYYTHNQKPDMEALFPSETPIAPLAPLAQVAKVAKVSGYDQLVKPRKPLPPAPPELRTLAHSDITRQLHSLKSLQKKDDNRLLYQTESMQKAPNPMPSGPKRTSIEKRMSERALKIKELESKLKTNLK